MKKNQTRAFAIALEVNRAEADAATFIPVALSSETPVRREYGDEILLHGPENIDMSRAIPNGLPLLVSHNDQELPIGRLKNLRLEDKRLRGDAYFSGRADAQAVRQDVLDGIVTDLSVGYKILDYKVEKAQRADEVNKVYVTRWMPREGSMVATGADASVGVGRAENLDPDQVVESLLEDQAEGGEAQETQERADVIGALQAALNETLTLGHTAQDAHWNVRGGTFGQLHELFGDLYDYLVDAADTVAERVVQLGGRALAQPVFDPIVGEAPYLTEVLCAKTAELVATFSRICAETAADPASNNIAMQICQDLEKYRWKLQSSIPGAKVMAGQRQDPSTQEEDVVAPVSDTEEEANRGVHPPVLDAESQSAEGDPQTIQAPPAEVAEEEAQEEASTVTQMNAESAKEEEQAEEATGRCERCDLAREECRCSERSDPDAEEEDEEEEEEGERSASEPLENRSDELLNEERLALRNVALNLKFRSEAEVDAILATTQDLEAARAQLLKPPTITYVKENPMSFNDALLKGLATAARGDFAALNQDELQGAIKQTGQRSFTADLFNTIGARADEMSTSTGGTNTIFQQNIGFLELLRARTAVLKAGGRTRQGIGSLAYMRQKQATTAALRAELGSVSNSYADFEKVPYVPKALTAKVILTDELQKESLLDLQNALRNDIVKQFAIAMDNYAINGATSPVAIGGLLSSGSGIYNGNLGTAALPTFKSVNALKALVDQKAVDLEACAYLATPGLFAVLETTSKFSGGIGLPIADGNKINGYNAFTSTNVPVNAVGTPAVDNHTLLFGDFSQLEICLQGPTEFDINTSTYFAEGLTVLSARQYFDVGILHPAAFAKCGNFLVA